MMAILTSCSNGSVSYDNVLHGCEETFTELVNNVSGFFSLRGDNSQMSDSISNYLNGMDAQTVEKFNQNSMEAVGQVSAE